MNFFNVTKTLPKRSKRTNKQPNQTSFMCITCIKFCDETMPKWAKKV